ncbi:MAG: polysaccharide biosynthesis/export family protein [Alphaproteobacteria bacterium]|nr:polysaccharide biosynthesis/export family protein [Alphaproteobacteria bacterium]
MTYLQRTTAGLCILFAAVAGGVTTPAAADPYRLGIDDMLRLKVFEWRDSVREVHEWSALNHDFTVGSNGDLSLPLIGTVPTAGKTVQELADNIAERLQSAVGMAKPPQVSVEIAQYRPFYIVGAVNKPGEYSYRPGLTVLQAIGIAGGLFRLSDDSMLQFRRAAQTTSGEFRVLVLQANRLQARRARLQAELSGAKEPVFPPELIKQQSDPEIASALKEEQRAFAAHRDQLQSEVGSRGQLKDLLGREIVSLQDKIASADQEIGMLKGELSKVSDFVRKGLAVAPREFSLRQNGMELQRTRLDLDTAVLRAKEEIGKTDQSIVEFQDQDKKEVLRDLEETSAKLAETSARIASTSQIINQDRATMPELAAASQKGNPVTYVIVRQDAKGTREVEASEGTPVQPGDTIKVRPSQLPMANGMAKDLSSDTGPSGDNASEVVRANSH